MWKKEMKYGYYYFMAWAYTYNHAHRCTCRSVGDNRAATSVVHGSYTKNGSHCELFFFPTLFILYSILHEYFFFNNNIYMASVSDTLLQRLQKGLNTKCSRLTMRWMFSYILNEKHPQYKHCYHSTILSWWPMRCSYNQFSVKGHSISALPRLLKWTSRSPSNIDVVFIVIKLERRRYNDIQNGYMRILH